MSSAAKKTNIYLNNVQLLNKVYTSRKILLEIMNSQNYNIDDYSNFSYQQVDKMLASEQLDMILTKNPSNTTSTNIVTNVQEPLKPVKQTKVYVSYYVKKTIINVQNIQEMIDELFILTDTLSKDDTLFIIIKDEINDTIRSELKHIWETEGIFIIITSINRLQFNILEHVMVPPHRILSEEEKTQVSLRYNISDEKYPEISRFDPVATAIGIRPGQVCEILRSSKTAVVTSYYRICV
jgi:DNA-directed RNA polymerase subunit H